MPNQLTYSLVNQNGGAAHGGVTMNPDGSFTYTPATGFVGTDQFTYQVTDPNVTSQAMVAVTVNHQSPVVTITDRAAFMAGTAEPYNLAASDPGSPESAMNTAFGTGNWTKVQGFTASVFSSGYNFIYIDGSGNDAQQFNAFIAANASAVQQYVANGGHLFINVSGDTASSVALGFGAVLNPDNNSTGTAVDANNAIFNGAGNTWSGNSSGNFFSQNAITGSGFTSLIKGGDGSVVLAMENVGSGTVYIGSISDPVFQSPQSQAETLRANILSVAAGFNGAAGQINISDPESATLAGAKISITGNFDFTQDLLVLPETLPSDITGSYDPETGVLTLTGTASIAEYQTVINSIQYLNTSELPHGGTRVLTYQVDDGATQNNLSNVGTFTVTVPGTQVAPVAGPPGSVSGTEDAQITGQVPQATDANNDAPTYALVGQANGGAQHGTVVMNLDGSFTYTPNAGFFGSDSFHYSAFDPSTGATGNTASVTVTVAPAPPVAQNGTASRNEDGGAIAGHAVATDVNASDMLSYSLIGSGGGAQHGSVVMHTDGSFSYTPDHGFFGTDTFTYQAADVTNGTIGDTATITVTVTPVAPVAQNGTAKGNEDDAAITGQVVATDVNATDTLSYSLVGSSGGAQNGSVVLHADGSFSYTPNQGFFGTDTFTYQAADTINHTVSNTATVTVTAAPVAPVANDGTTSGHEDDVFIKGQAVATDVNATDPLSYSLVGTTGGAKNGFVLMNADGSFSYTPNHGFFGTDTFSYQVVDTINGTTSNTATITVTVAPTAPVAEGTFASGNENAAAITGQAIAIELNATDALTYSLMGSGSTLNGGSVVMHADGSFVYTPKVGFSGTDTFSFTASDTENGTTSNPATVSVFVIGVPPVAANGSVSGHEDDVAITGHAVAMPPGATDQLVYSLISQNGGAQGASSVVMNADGSFNYTPKTGFFGTDTFTYEVIDETNGTVSNAATIGVTVAATPPVAENGSAAGHEDTTINGHAVATDVNETDSLSYSLLGSNGGAKHGTVAIQADGSLTYTPSAGFVGTDTFSYSAFDFINHTTSSTATITVTVDPVAPSVSAGPTLSVNEGTTVPLTISETPFDALDPVTIKISGVPSDATLSAGVHNADGSWTLTPQQLAGLTLTTGRRRRRRSRSRRRILRVRQRRRRRTSP